jgi:hypothetical protein
MSRRSQFTLPLLAGVAATLLALTWLPPPDAARAQEASPSIVPTLDAGPSQLEAFARLTLDAAHSPHRSLLVVLVLIALVYAVYRWGTEAARSLGLMRLSSALASDRAGAIEALALSVLGAVATAAVAGRPVTASLILTALGIGLKAIGGYVGARKILGIKSGAAGSALPAPGIIAVLLLALCALPARAEPEVVPPAAQAVLDRVGTGALSFDKGKITIGWGPVASLAAMQAQRLADGRLGWTGAKTYALGVQGTLGFWPARDGNQRVHLSVPLLMGFGAAGDGKGLPVSAIVGFTIGFGGFEHVPLFSIGPGYQLVAGGQSQLTGLLSGHPDVTNFQLLISVSAVQVVQEVLGAAGR